MIRNLSLTIIVLTFLQSCALQRISLKDESLKSISTGLNFTSIDVKDVRTNKKEIDLLKAPFISTKRFESIAHPELDQTRKNSMLTVLNKANDKHGRPAELMIELVIGECKLYGNAVFNAEHAKVQVKLTVTEPDQGKTRNVYSEVYHTQKTLHAMAKPLVKIYDILLKQATYNALEKLMEPNLLQTDSEVKTTTTL